MSKEGETEKQESTKCTKYFKFVECEKNKVFNLSTFKIQKNVENSRFSKSYSHYPHKNPQFM